MPAPLSRGLLLSCQGADLVRVWNLHQTLLCFDYESDESNEVKDLLLQCFMSIKHIKKEEVSQLLSHCGFVLLSFGCF